MFADASPDLDLKRRLEASLELVDRIVYAQSGEVVTVHNQ